MCSTLYIDISSFLSLFILLHQTLGHVHLHVCEFNLKFDVAVGERNGPG